MHGGAQHEMPCTCSDLDGAGSATETWTSNATTTPSGSGSSTHALAGGLHEGTTRAYAAFTLEK
eukprot:31314-Pelagococcus_subviridis.AAC.23